MGRNEVLLRIRHGYDGSADQSESCSTAVKSCPRNQLQYATTARDFPWRFFVSFFAACARFRAPPLIPAPWNARPSVRFRGSLRGIMPGVATGVPPWRERTRSLLRREAVKDYKLADVGRLHFLVCASGSKLWCAIVKQTFDRRPDGVACLFPHSDTARSHARNRHRRNPGGVLDVRTVTLPWPRCGVFIG